MILYHGSNIIINEIDLSKCRPLLKILAKGFIVRKLKNKRNLMAKRVARIYGGKAYVRTR